MEKIDYLEARLSEHRNLTSQVDALKKKMDKINKNVNFDQVYQRYTQLKTHYIKNSTIVSSQLTKLNKKVGKQSNDIKNLTVCYNELKYENYIFKLLIGASFGTALILGITSYTESK